MSNNWDPRLGGYRLAHRAEWGRNGGLTAVWINASLFLLVFGFSNEDRK